MITTITMGHKNVHVDHINQPFANSPNSLPGTAHPGRCGTFETLDSRVDLEEFIWCLHKTAGAPPVCFVYAFVYICRWGRVCVWKET